MSLAHILTPATPSQPTTPTPVPTAVRRSLCPRALATVAPLLALATTLLTAGPLHAASAEPIDPIRYDQRPLLRLQAVGWDFFGEPFEVNVAIDRGGPTLFASDYETGPSCRIEHVVGDERALRELNQALARHQVGRQRGNCGYAAPDYVERYSLTWYGLGGRVHTLQVGGIYGDCKPDVVAIFDAACNYLWQTVGDVVEYCVPRDPQRTAAAPSVR
jgi:hypothetical protein